MRLLLLAAAVSSRCPIMINDPPACVLLCLAAFVARLGEMVVFLSRVFDALYLLWESVGCASIEAVTASTASSSVLVT